MIYSLKVSVLMGVCVFVSCKETPAPEIAPSHQKTEPTPSTKEEEISDYNTEEWTEITTDGTGIILDIRYATTNNFTKEIIYDCGRCFLRPEAASKLIALNEGIMERYKLRLKVFDCYRPRPAQQKLWAIVPNASYVTPPEKGSMHNRGMAIDLTLTDMEGLPLDMGTAYDHFGIEAHIDNLDLPEQVLANRNLLKTMMKEIAYQGIRTEWWHYSYQEKYYDLSDWEWNCK